ncbi:hypothetical protein TNIN_72701 [Trichonephila inaurata madagascariensis]|uniref:Uncharacterized protein n=1 Tax=Trichonephila inaurata madagascariensis TaxID=2747483 RepID=A0A8X6WYB9_9ARAC|nr:hypothetical protein TNIN_72701 [Trichonephila inaurata madagascariensis]
MGGCPRIPPFLERLSFHLEGSFSSAGRHSSIVVSSRVCRSSADLASRTRSSVNSRIALPSLPSWTFASTWLIARLNNIPLKGQPCLTPRLMAIGSVSSSPANTGR